MEGTARRRTPGGRGKTKADLPPAAKAEAPLDAAEVRLRLLRLTDELARLGPRPVEQAPEGRRPSLVRRGAEWLRRAVVERRAPQLSPRHEPTAVLVGASLDTAWANAAPGFEGLSHVFHQEWHGIRAAAGYLPGGKVAISAEHRLSLGNIEQVIDALQRQKTSVVVFHGWSENAALLTHALRRTLGRRPAIKVVWHGNTSQFINPYEFAQVGQLVDFVRRGVIDALGSVKPDLHLLDPCFAPELLLNVGPRVASTPVRRQPSRAALLPVPLDWRKNLHTNLYAASVAGFERVYVTARLPKALPVPLRAEVVRVERPERAALFGLVREVDLVLNASLSECQPMTALEALSLGVPCVTGKLRLGRLDEHPYQRLAQVAGVDTLGPVVDAIVELRRRAEREPLELAELLADYDAVLRREAFARLARFLE